MATPFVTLEGVSHVLPDGRALFSLLSDTFDARPTGLVGRNGVGKTVLARILAGLLPPSAGQCTRNGQAFYLAQQITPPASWRVADLCGAGDVLGALARVAAGSTAQADFDAVGEQWDMPQRLAAALQQHGLGHLQADRLASTLSGGETMRVALLGAWLAEADFLILDEPTNHLDQPSRQALMAQLARWDKGLLVISHDRVLLGTMARIVELSPLGLRSYGGNYDCYVAARAQEQAAAQALLAQRKQIRAREEQAMRAQAERAQRREARGHQQARTANQAKILLDRQKERSQASAGRWRQQQAEARADLQQQVRAAASQVAQDAAIVLHALPAVARHGPREVVVVVRDGVLPYAPAATQHLSLQVQAGQRIGVVGDNGSGKSTLLRVMAGDCALVSGHAEVRVACAYLDQRLAALPPEQSAAQALAMANPGAGEAQRRTWLAHLGLAGDKAVLATGNLSGGERLKAALACVLYAAQPQPLLLLDEQDNHLDLPSLQALEAMLCRYSGTLMVVSHDEAFLHRLALTHRLAASPQGWRLAPWLAMT